FGRTWVVGESIDRFPHALPNPTWKVLDLLPCSRSDVHLVATHVSSFLTSFHSIQPARRRLPFAAFNSASAWRTICASSSVSSHSTSASQSSALSTASRLPFLVTNWTDCNASVPVMAAAPLLLEESAEDRLARRQVQSYSPSLPSAESGRQTPQSIAT